jgi:hypothetical protein
MERTFEANTREQANQKADEWWAKAKGLRFVHRSQTPAGFRSYPSKRWAIACASVLGVILSCGGQVQAGSINLDASTRAEVESGMDEQIALINHNSPIEVAPQQKLISATRHGELVIYTYELAGGGAGPATAPQSIQMIADEVIKSNCKERKDTRLLLDVGYELKHVWYDQKGTFVSDVLVTKQSCVSAGL